MSVLDKFMPRVSGIRDPRDKTKKNGMFWNYPRFLRFGGVAKAPMQDGSKGPNMSPGTNQVGPISDRGRGR